MVRLLERGGMCDIVPGRGESEGSAIMGIICKAFSFHTCKRRGRINRQGAVHLITRWAKIDCGNRLSFARQVWATYLVKSCSLAQLRLDDIVCSDMRLWLIICDCRRSSRPWAIVTMEESYLESAVLCSQRTRGCSFCPHILTCRHMFRLDAVTLTACADPVLETKLGGPDESSQL